MVWTGAEVTQAPLMMGTFVSAEIAGRPGGDLFVMPGVSIYRGETIWLVDEDSTIGPARVDVVRADENYFYISEGLVEGDRYCYSGRAASAGNESPSQQLELLWIIRTSL